VTQKKKKRGNTQHEQAKGGYMTLTETHL
jgi:hypothetical protein